MKEIERIASEKIVYDDDLNELDLQAENRTLSVGKKKNGWQSQKTKHIPTKENRVTITSEEIENAKAEFYEKEGHLRNNCFDFLEALPMCKPIDTSTLNFGRKKHVRKKPGVADLHCSYFGLFVAIETKIGDNGQSDDQKDYQEEVESSGGVYLLIYSLSALVNAMNVLRLKLEKLGLHI